MILTNNMIKENLNGYSNKNTKICREIKKGNLIKIINGLYETNPSINGYLLARSIYGPSYLSFKFALSYYGVIPKVTDILQEVLFIFVFSLFFTVFYFI